MSLELWIAAALCAFVAWAIGPRATAYVLLGLFAAFLWLFVFHDDDRPYCRRWDA